MAQGEFALVRDNIEKAIQIHKAGGYIIDSDLYAMVVDAAVQQHDEIAIRKYAPILEQAAAALEHKLFLAITHRAWGVLHRQEGQHKQAEARLLQATTLFHGLDTRWQLGRTHFELGELAAETNELVKAEQHYTNALALFEEMGAAPDAGRTQAAMSALNG